MKKGQLIKGIEALSLPVGSVIKVVSISGDEYSDSGDEGSIIMKLKNKQAPFVEITEPSMWGRYIEDYTFEYIDHILNLIHGKGKDI